MTSGASLRVLRTAALVPAGFGSVALLLRAGRRNESLLLAVLFLTWVLSPFVTLLWANLVSKRWSVISRAALYGVTLVLAVGSLAVYGEVIRAKPPGAPNAGVTSRRADRRA